MVPVIEDAFFAYSSATLRDPPRELASVGPDGFHPLSPTPKRALERLDEAVKRSTRAEPLAPSFSSSAASATTRRSARQVRLGGRLARRHRSHLIPPKSKTSPRTLTELQRSRTSKLYETLHGVNSFKTREEQMDVSVRGSAQRRDRGGSHERRCGPTGKI